MVVRCCYLEPRSGRHGIGGGTSGFLDLCSMFLMYLRRPSGKGVSKCLENALKYWSCSYG